MHEQDHELLSAYFDGECSPEERRRAEEVLDDSDAARRELEELRVLSQLLGDLPGERVSSAFGEAIRARTERGRAASSVREGSVGRHRGWLVTTCAVAISAAVLLVAVSVLDRAGSTTEPSADGTASRPSGESVAAKDRAGDEDRAEAQEEAEPLVAATSAEDVDGRDRVRSLGSSDANESLDEIVVLEREQLVPSNQVARPSTLEARHLRLGDVLPYVDRSGEQVAVVQVTVVDVRRAADRIRVLLQRNDIPAARNGSWNQAARKGSGGGAGKDLFALFVRTSPEQLATTLEQIRTEESVVSLEAPPQLAGAGAALAGGTGNRRADDVARANVTDSKKTADSAKSTDDKAAQPPKVAKLFRAEERFEGVAPGFQRSRSSYQVLVPVEPAAVQRKLAAGHGALRGKRRSERDPAAASDENAGEKDDTAESEAERTRAGVADPGGDREVRAVIVLRSAKAGGAPSRD